MIEETKKKIAENLIPSFEEAGNISLKLRIDGLKTEIKKDKDINELKILLANEATTMLHGKKAAQDSEEAAKEAFSGKLLGSNLPTIKISIIDLVILSKLENSKSEIRRLIKGNAIKINDQIISDEKLIIKYDLFNEDYLKLSVGKKRHLKIEIN